MNEQTGTAQPPGTKSIAMYGDCELSTRSQVSSARNSRIVTVHLVQQTQTDKRNEHSEVSDVREHILSACKYLLMYNKIFIYGDSFSDPRLCQTTQDHMWYRVAFSKYANSEIVPRTKPGMATDNMFLLAGHDCVTHSEPCLMVIALGPLQRIAMYEDGWYDQEHLKEIEIEGAGQRWPQPPRPTDLSDCVPRFDSLPAAKVRTENANLYHPTLLWARLYDHVIKLTALAKSRGHTVLVLHMSHMDTEHYERHPLTRPLQTEVANCNYITTEHSCALVCEKANIRPVDFAEYGAQGHHGPEGQQHFGAHIKGLTEEMLT